MPVYKLTTLSWEGQLFGAYVIVSIVLFSYDALRVRVRVRGVFKGCSSLAFFILPVLFLSSLNLRITKGLGPYSHS